MRAQGTTTSPGWPTQMKRSPFCGLSHSFCMHGVGQWYDSVTLMWHVTLKAVSLRRSRRVEARAMDYSR